MQCEVNSKLLQPGMDGLRELNIALKESWGWALRQLRLHIGNFTLTAGDVGT